MNTLDNRSGYWGITYPTRLDDSYSKNDIACIAQNSYAQGANEQLRIDIENACEALYGLMNDLNCDLMDIEKAKEYVKSKMLQGQ